MPHVPPFQSPLSASPLTPEAHMCSQAGSTQVGVMPTLLPFRNPLPTLLENPSFPPTTAAQCPIYLLSMSLSAFPCIPSLLLLLHVHQPFLHSELQICFPSVLHRLHTSSVLFIQPQIFQWCDNSSSQRGEKNVLVCQGHKWVLVQISDI